MKRILFVKEWLHLKKARKQKEILEKLIKENNPSLKEFYRNEFWKPLRLYKEKHNL